MFVGVVEDLAMGEPAADRPLDRIDAGGLRSLGHRVDRVRPGVFEHVERSTGAGTDVDADARVDHVHGVKRRVVGSREVDRVFESLTRVVAPVRGNQDSVDTERRSFRRVQIAGSDYQEMGTVTGDDPLVPASLNGDPNEVAP